MRVAIAEDMALLRDGIARFLGDAGIDVVAQVADATALLEAVDRHRPDAAVVDIRMPPTFTDEGIGAADAIRERFPGTAVLLLSSHLDSRFATTLLTSHPTSCGYLLKEHVSAPGTLVDALTRVVSGESVIDPAVVAALLERKRVAGPLDSLTTRQREILALMAEGHANARICALLHLSPRTVESHVRAIFTTLGLAESNDTSRRVLAVLAYLRR